MMIKIDLEKAFDRMEWSFVRSMLFSMGFHQDTIDLILSGISSTDVSLLFNGSQLEEFQPSRGLRQGDPISPYIFILCMEFLSTLIHRKCEKGDWTRVKASRSGPGFSHIFFADDLLLFASTSQKNTEAVSEVLEEFCQLTGQKINLAKSKIFFSANTSEEDKEKVVHHLGIAETSNLGKYLGFPILHNGRRRNDFQFVVERVQSKLAGWKSKCLSPAGRLVLLKAAVSPIPEYFMQCCKLPARVCDEVDRLVRDFLWGSTSNKKKIHLVGWSKITSPKELGGLGIFQANARNSALLAKLCWRIASSPDKPWAQMLISKYLTPARLGDGGKKLPASRIWAACKVGGAIFNKGLKWSVANGEMINAWEDFWLPSGPLRHQIEGPLTEGEDNISVKLFLGNRASISFNLPDTISKEIQGIPTAMNPDQKDILVWAYSKDGSFSLSSAYLLAKGLNLLNPVTTLGQWVWKSNTTPRIKFFFFGFVFIIASQPEKSLVQEVLT
ncbi:hypothetical protein SO802_032678 [Lithocarpus litseifolius]|uniref:Reverse transcriptase domain-containing protein n=1 Tax=Lithocarpus litseifolius TaxID=425828 RepID=A0AAW2BC96_9ROSI